MRTSLYSLVTACLISTATMAATPRVEAQSIAPPKQIKRVEPVYPESARPKGIVGVVVVKATIGPDGKVGDAVVIQSIPELDEAALVAVRQWEYEPTLIRGVPVPVTMTVRVGFSLNDKTTEGRELLPIIVSRNATDWTFNGTPLLDDNMPHWLSLSYVKQPVIVDTNVATTYADLVKVLASLVKVGVQDLFVYGGGDPKQAIRIKLEALPIPLESVAGADPETRLPTAEIEWFAVMPDIMVTVGPYTPLRSALTAMRGLKKGATVRLLFDRDRTAAEAWEVLRDAHRGGVDLFLLSVKYPYPRPSATAPVK